MAEITNEDGTRNWEVNILLDNVKRLEQENAELKAYKDVNEDFKTAWEELKAENERLKEEIKIRDNLSETFRKEALNWANISNDCIKDIENYKQTLQEIKGVVTALYMNNWLQMNETARKSIQLLQEFITKAEEE